MSIANKSRSIKTKRFFCFKQKYAGNEGEYLKYRNFNAINVDKASDIPADYKGIVGVPITFLNKLNSEQFKIIKFRKGSDEKDLVLSNGRKPYFRVLIQKQEIQKQE